MIDTNILGPIVNLGAVGCCLVVLAVYYMKKDKKYEARIDERLAIEKEFRKEMSDHQEKYRIALEKFNQTLDTVIRIHKKEGGMSS